MSEKTNETKVFSLLEVMQSIKRTLMDRYQSPFWVKAEMNKLNHYPLSGHCYPELLEKRDGKVIAQVKATLWKEDFARITENFLTVLKEPVRDGISILFLARITFDPVYGLSLRILDIDPSYSLGELEREKQEAIARLRREGFFTMNRSLGLALLPQRIAVISVASSKGYADFTTTINENPWKYRFFYMLFPSLLQGEKVTESIIGQLSLIEKVKHHFDAVAIIRGGGGDIGLAGFNNYALAQRVASFPLPVITGIGHATNETVTELVAYRNCITPTDLAGFLLQQYHNFSVTVSNAARFISDEGQQIIHTARRDTDELTGLFLRSTRDLIRKSNTGLKNHAISIRSHTNMYIRTHALQILQVGRLTGKVTENLIARERTGINRCAEKLTTGSGLFFHSAGKELDSIARHVSALDPARVLARGFTITRYAGKIVNKAADVEPGSVIETTTSDGIIKSSVTDIGQYSPENINTENES